MVVVDRDRRNFFLPLWFLYSITGEDVLMFF